MEAFFRDMVCLRVVEAKKNKIKPKQKKHQKLPKPNFNLDFLKFGMSICYFIA